MFENLIATLKADKRKIVFTEGQDPRILEAASRLKRDGLLHSLLVGDEDKVMAAAQDGGFDINDIDIIDPANYRRSTRWPRRWSNCARARSPWTNAVRC